MNKLLTPAVLTLAVAGASVWAQEEGAFRFEDYTERTAFEEAVTQRFPVGSSYLAFKRQVIPAGAKATRNMLSNDAIHTHTFVKKERPTTGKNFLTTWTVNVVVNSDTITAISPTLVTVGAHNQEF